MGGALAIPIIIPNGGYRRVAPPPILQILPLVIPAQPGIDFLVLELKSNLDAGLRRHDKSFLCLQAWIVTIPRETLSSPVGWISTLIVRQRFDASDPFGEVGIIGRQRQPLQIERLRRLFGGRAQYELNHRKYRDIGGADGVAN
jgi:hypothetical protein